MIERATPTPTLSQPRHGWFKLAFESEVPPGISSWRVGTIRMILIREGSSIRCFDANCPHRGADLGISGTLTGDAIRCSFHGYLIGLGPNPCTSGRWKLREYATHVMGCMVLVRLSDQFTFGLEQTLAELAREHVFAEALHLQVRAPMSLVVENGFDALHFGGVHGIRALDFHTQRDAAGPLGVSGTFQAPFRQRRDGTALSGLSSIPFAATAFSPGLIMVELGGEMPYGVLTGATDRGDGLCDVRLTFILPKDQYGEAPTRDSYQTLIDYSRTGIEDDRRVWESIQPGFSPHFGPEDAPVKAFHAFCADFV